ncbi:hypothetical protein BDF19DRAFT_56265 [Syncephalis fuscata]|nr:hypothetical protein BDF19DRAFT_56265 [Syncephalis fuscata]
MEAQYSKENENEVYNPLDEYSISLSAITASYERYVVSRRALLVWPVAGNSPPNIIYLDSKDINSEKPELRRISTIYEDWMFLDTYYEKEKCYKYYLFNLDANQWIEGPRHHNRYSLSCIQFASYSQCQFIMWKIISNSVKSNTDSKFITTPDPQIDGNGNQVMRIQWEVFDAQKGQSQCQKILSDQITIPYCPNATIETLTYTEKMCLIIIYDQKNQTKRLKNRTFSATLSLFVLGKFSPNDSAQSIFDARDYGRVLPIDSADQGHVLWSRSISHNRITKLYSEKLIVVQNRPALDVLAARNGIIALNHLSTLLSTCPFLGSLCELFSSENKENWFVDMRTGRIYNPPTILLTDK